MPAFFFLQYIDVEAWILRELHIIPKKRTMRNEKHEIKTKLSSSFREYSKMGNRDNMYLVAPGIGMAGKKNLQWGSGVIFDVFIILLYEPESKKFN